jgi:hypothetical protein
MDKKLDKLDDCTPLELHHEIRNIDCSLDRAKTIWNYANMVSREQIYEGDGGLAWFKLAEAIEDLWEDYPWSKEVWKYSDG